MTRDTHHVSRRTVLQTAAGAGLAGVAGCLHTNENTSSDGASTSPDEPGILDRVAVEDTTLVAEFSSTEPVDQLNLIQPNGELFGQQDVAEGSQQVSFELGTAYPPGEYSVVALSGEETLSESAMVVQPELQIRDVGLYRNNPDKPWDEVYGNSETNRKMNGEAFVTVENTGSGPTAAIELRFSGDVPNLIENPRGSGIYGTDQLVVRPDETTDLFSSSFPFGTETEGGIGCSKSGNGGEFTVVVETRVTDNQASSTYNVQYSGSDDMTDCEVRINKV